MSIPALGGGGSQALQRALLDAAERAVADELELLDGEDPAAAASGAGAAMTRAQVRRRATAGSAEIDAPLDDEAIVVELGEERRASRLEVADGWITAKRGPLETRDDPEGLHAAQPKRDADAEPLPTEPLPTEPLQTEPRVAPPRTAPRSEPGAEPKTEPESESATLERLLVVLKKTGIDFRDAYQVLREIRAGAPLPPRAELRALWVAADPSAWEERARIRDNDLRQTPVDDVIRDRSWHSAAAHDPSAARPAPTLQTVAQHTPANHAYVAELSTAEFQRLVTILGGTAPEWFWELRGHRGLRGLAERPAIARLNATRIAGTRLGAWLLAILGMALLWYIGLHTDIWW